MSWRAPQLEELALALAAPLPPLQLGAARLAAGLHGGAHGRRRPGVGEGFWQFRRYGPGDDAARIDWRQSAKREHIYVREHEWEAVQTLCLWTDLSPSMHYASDDRHSSKSYRALLLACALGCLALRGGEQVLALNGEQRAPLRNRGALPRLAQYLSRQARAGALPHPPALPRNGVAAMFSDFLMPLPALAAALQGAATRGCSGALVQVLDPAEISFPFAGHVLMEDSEGAEPLDLRRAEALADLYRKRMTERQEAVRALARQAGWHFLVHDTASDPRACLMQLFTWLQPPEHQQNNRRQGARAAGRA
ncbi:MAG: DUF58 domain-containing protein [Alphaproteobacteria bacterium]|nr:DUF58 domain-containing protein [Alphaproteobacteria bacterium]